MDIDSFGKGIGLISSTLATIKQIAGLLPDNSKKHDILASLEMAERELKIAESESATGLGYEICRQHFPPVIMLSSDNKNWECPECHNTKKPDNYDVDTLSQHFKP